MTPDTIDLQIRELVRKLAKFHWSPKHPSAYVLPHPESGKPVGVGIIAMQCPGAFNLMYVAVNGELSTIEDHRKAIDVLVTCGRLSRVEVEKHPLSSWLTLFTEEEFKNWMQTNVNCNGSPELTQVQAQLGLQDVRGV
jgi:hypothetical protein